MKLKILVMGLIVCIVMVGCSIAKNKDERLFTNEQWIEDIDYTVQEIFKHHVDAFNTFTEDEWVEEVNQLKSDLDKLSDRDISLRLEHIVTLVRDAHTGYSSELKQRYEKIYPFTTKWFEDELRVTKSLSQDQNIIGTKLVAINGILIDEVIDKVNTSISHENNQWLKFNNQMLVGDYNLLSYLGITKKEIAEFTFENDLGESTKIKLEPMSRDSYLSEDLNTLWDDLSEDKKPVAGLKYYDTKGEFDYTTILSEDFWYTYVEEDELLYLQYNNSVDDNNEEFNQMIKDIEASIKDKQGQMKKLVVDLRFNVGGASTGFTKYANQMKLYQDVFPFETYTLMGPATFSSGTLAVFDTKYFLDSTLVGEETGGNNIAYGVCEYRTLPNTSGMISISTQPYDLKFGGYHGILPDIEVIQSLEGAKLGIDEAYDVIRDIGKSQ
ncbi:MAG: hypothetical protein ACRCS6_01840 [Turicibacter sp.]